MIITKMALPRRAFLRGLGVTVALPLLDAMVPAMSAMASTAAKARRDAQDLSNALAVSTGGGSSTPVTNTLLTYALGRGVEYYDAPAVRKVVRESREKDYRFSSLVLGIVNSTPFQMRRSQ